jgi:alpha 1,2-mannosyltransferase
MSFGQEGDYSSFKRLSAQLAFSEQSALPLSVNQTNDTPLEHSKPSPSPFDHTVPQVTPHSHSRRANATLVMLARNSDLDGVISSVEQMEAKFNRNFKYPWVFLNDEPFSVDFKRYVMSILSVVGFSSFFRRVSVLTEADVSFGVVPRESWVQPDWIDEQRAQEGRNSLVRQGVIYGGEFIIVWAIPVLTT